MPPEGLRGVAQPALFAHLAALAGDQAQVAEAMAEGRGPRSNPAVRFGVRLLPHPFMAQLSPQLSLSKLVYILQTLPHTDLTHRDGAKGRPSHAILTRDRYERSRRHRD